MIYDLTHMIRDDLPVYPGDPKPVVQPVATLAHDGYAVSSVTIGTHTGTHIDAPQHMLDSGKSLHEYPVERFIVQAVCIDVHNGFEAKAIKQQIYRPGLAVLFCTGASNYFNEPRYWHDFPVLDLATISVLIGMQVPLVGVDAGSFDNDESFSVHKALLGADILLVENLTNLGQLIGKQIELTALPLKLAADGAPVRVIARAG